MQPKGSFGTFEKLLTVYSEGKGRSKGKSEEKRGKSEREREKKTAIIALLNFFLFIIGVANGTSKTWFSEKFWLDLEISEAFLISLEVSFFHGLFLLFLSLETFHQRVLGSDF